MAALCGWLDDQVTPLDRRDAQILRRSHNLTFAVSDVVVRLFLSQRQPSVVEREVRLIRGLVAAGFRTPPLLAVEQPITTPHGTIMVFERLRTAPVKSHSAQTGELLAAFHRVAATVPIDWPVWDPFHRLPSRLKAAAEAGMPQHLVDQLHSLAESIRSSVAEWDDPLGEGVVHGDAHTGNMIAVAGLPWLLDFEEAGWAPQAFDLVPAAIAVERFGAEPETFEAACEGYGTTLRAPDLRPLVAVKQLMMVSWMTEMWGEGKDVQREIEHRLTTFDEPGERWSPR